MPTIKFNRKLHSVSGDGKIISMPKIKRSSSGRFRLHLEAYHREGNETGQRLEIGSVTTWSLGNIRILILPEIDIHLRLL